MDKILNYLLSAIPLGMTFLYGSTGEILTEKAGHLNLGIPGIMCVGTASMVLSVRDRTTAEISPTPKPVSISSAPVCPNNR